MKTDWGFDVCLYDKCKKKFKKTRKWHKYCKVKCRKEDWEEKHRIRDIDTQGRVIVNIADDVAKIKERLGMK